MFRWWALAVFVASLGVSARHRWRARQTAGSIPRGAEPPGLIAARMVVALPLFGGVVTYLAYPPSMAWASVGLPLWARWTGVVLGVLVVASIHWVLTNLGSNVSETVLTKAQQQLVTTGPYRWVRHPLYTTGLALFVSIGLMAANGFILLWTLVAAIGIRVVVIPGEEAQLIARFGDAYKDYRRRTRALFPLLH